MHLNSEALPEGTLLKDYDICVAGAGAAGLAMARRFAGGSKRVLVLAAGQPGEKGLPPGFRQKIYGGTYGDFLAKVDPLFLRRSRLHMFGGTTNHFGFWSRPLDETDFLPRPGYRQASRPLRLVDLTPYYREAMEYGHYGPLNFDDLPYWERILFARNFPRQEADSLTGAIFHAQYEERLHDFQVQVGDELRDSSNVTILFNANLLRLEASPDRDHVTSLACASIEGGQAGRRFRVVADTYVLALGGIETVRVLKLSGDLGNNAKDMLGRGFMVHPLITTVAEARFSQPVAGEIRNFFHDQQVRLRQPESPGGGYVHDTAPLVDPRLLFKHRVFNAWGVLVPTPETLATEAIGGFRVILRFDPEGDRAELNINWEQVPNEESRITLDPEVVDPVFRQSAVHLDWRLLEVDKRTVVRAMGLCESYLRTKGATGFRLLTDLDGGAGRWIFGRAENALATGDHHMGALRMSATIDDGIVDARSRFHAVDNLYAAGCSQFPTSGYANPTLTIVALALRLADHLSGA
ncbi:MAG: GMC oxidoreductase [Spirochaetota bacterium]